MPNDGRTDVPEDVRGRLLDPVTHLSAEISRPGYTMPDLDGLVWTEFSAQRTSAQLHVSPGKHGRNWLVAPPGHEWAGWTAIHVHGNHEGNVLVIGRDSRVKGDIHFYGDGHTVIFGDNVWQPSTVSVHLWQSGATAFWGRGTTSKQVIINIQANAGRIVIGDDCMIARDVTIRDSDMHAVVDMISESWLNPSADVLIEPHVWLAEECWVMRGSRIGLGSIIGGKTVVRGTIPRFSTAAGVPARVVRQNVSWTREMMPQAKAIAKVREMARSIGPFDEGVAEVAR